MEQHVNKMVGEVPFPFLVAERGKPLNLYYNSSMVIMETKQGVDFPQGSHLHASYEFMIPISSLAVIKLDNSIFPAEFYKVKPINSEQSHGSAGFYKNCYCFSWHIDSDLVKNLASAMYGKSELFFSNDSIPVSKEVSSLLNSFMDEYKHKQPGGSFILDSLATQLTITLLRQVKNNCSYVEEKNIFSARPNIQRAIEYLHDNYQACYSLQDVAHIADLSPYHFLRLFKNNTGKTPYTYLLDIKINKSKELLKNSEHTVTEVCFLCGFNNVSHFATLFKRKVGVFPIQL